MYAVILAGGSGTRLWPLSREKFPKQYLPLPETAEDSADKSLFQATFERVTGAVEAERIIVVTHRDQASEARRQLELAGLDSVSVLEEPQARNTAPAIGLAAFYLHQAEGPETVMAVLPSDHLITDRQAFSELLKMGESAAQSYGLVTYGIRPTYPETGYGYICCGDKLDQHTHSVARFVEKPDLKTAQNYFKDPRYLWNSGMFVFKVGALLEEYRRHLPDMHYALSKIDYKAFSNAEAIYHDLEKISIDYGILERSGKVTVIPTSIKWSDLGSWEAYYQVSDKDEQGNYIRGRVLPFDTEDSLIVSHSRLVGAIGLKDLVIVDTDDALLVCSREQGQEVKKIVDWLTADDAIEAKEHRTIYRPWGSYTSLELTGTYQVKRINVNPGARLSLQSHRHRSENWIVTGGEALVTVNDDHFTVKKGERAYIPAGARHRMENRGSEPLILIEVQTGDYLGEDDIIRYEDDYGRAGGNTLSNSNSADNPGLPGKAVGFDAPAPEKFAENSHYPVQKNEPSGAGRKEIPGHTALENYKLWLNQPGLDPKMHQELTAMQNDPEAIESHFGRELVFGTGGMRDVIGPGLNRINTYTVSRATQGLANYLNSLPDQEAQKETQQVAIAYDTRLFSDQFAERAALVLAANGIKALLFSDIRPTPILSFITREMNCAAGIVITASHNPPEYNGYKVYGPDGGQAVSPLVDEVVKAIQKVDIFKDVKSIAKEEALAGGMLEMVAPEVDQIYLDKVRTLSLSQPKTRLKVVFTPLHGTGLVHIPELLAGLDCVELYQVEAQSSPDQRFSTVKSPNPEDPAALDMALEEARRVQAALVLATDPDGDRVGTAVLDTSGKYVILSGNQVGALLIEYICSRLFEKGELPDDAVIIKTIVTGNLGRRIAESYGLLVVETLTGFKFIGEKMKEFAEEGTPQFIFGYEESCGYLSGTFVRDKDAVISSYLIAEMTAYYLEKGQNLLQVLERIQAQHGFFAEDLFTVGLKDISEADRYVAAYQDLPAEMGGFKVAEKRDYKKKKGLDLINQREFALTLPRSPVLHYTMEDEAWFAVRPSGTEPKVKFYLSAQAADPKTARDKLARLKEAVLSAG